VTGQTWNPETYARNARFVSDLGAGVVELLAPRPGERILDLACGDGALTASIAASGAEVVGVDASEEQVRGARARGLDARVARAEALPFAAEFDAVFSNAALHWIQDQDAMLDSVHRALRPGGRFVAEMGGAGNVGAIRAALVEALDRRGGSGRALDTLFLPTAEEYRARLEAHGFTVGSLSLFARPTPLPGDLSAWLETFAHSFLRAVPEAERPRLIDEVTTALRPRLFDAQRGWIADYVRLRFAAVRG
jgi:trans-aconitate methyltransferase